MDLRRFVIYIPAYNAAVTLPRVIERIPPAVRETVKEILVVDNHSADNTHLIALRIKNDQNVHNLEVIRNA
ncbi:MAG: glycosyltransferase, partial [Bdellovibrionales bacterium]|nr:glycosyltransferase [Bdellovibrionales bacterium]